jgi:hypothetical protein
MKFHSAGEVFQPVDVLRGLLPHGGSATQRSQCHRQGECLAVVGSPLEAPLQMVVTHFHIILMCGFEKFACKGNDYMSN